MNQPTKALSSIEGIAEGIQGMLGPAMRDNSKIDLEDIIDVTRDCYMDVLWDEYMRLFSQGDRAVLDGLLSRQPYELKDSKTQICIEDISIADIPRDAGIYQVLPYGKDNVSVGKPFTKSSAGAAFLEKSPIMPKFRYYRSGKDIYFPDGVPDAAIGINVLFYGLTTDNRIAFISRGIAQKVRVKVWQTYMPGVQIPADNTNNANPNQ